MFYRLQCQLLVFVIASVCDYSHCFFIFIFFYRHPLFQITSTLHHNGLCNMFSDILRVSVPGLLFCVYGFALRCVVGAPITRRVSRVNKLALDADIVGRGVVDLVNRTELCVHVLPGVGDSHEDNTVSRRTSQVTPNCFIPT